MAPGPVISAEKMKGSYGQEVAAFCLCLEGGKGVALDPFRNVQGAHNGPGSELEGQFPVEKHRVPSAWSSLVALGLSLQTRVSSAVLRLSCYRAFLLILSASRFLVYMFHHLSAGGLYANSLCCVHVCMRVCFCRPEVNHECSSGDIFLVMITHWPESHISLG